MDLVPSSLTLGSNRSPPSHRALPEPVTGVASDAVLTDVGAGDRAVVRAVGGAVVEQPGMGAGEHPLGRLGDQRSGGVDQSGDGGCLVTDGPEVSGAVVVDVGGVRGDRGTAVPVVGEVLLGEGQRAGGAVEEQVVQA